MEPSIGVACGSDLAIGFGPMRKLVASLGLIGVALALAASPAPGAYRTSPEEGLKYTTLHMKLDQGGRASTYALRGCWRIGPGGVGTYGLYSGGVVCRFSGPVYQGGPNGEDACRIADYAAKQKKPKKSKKAKKKFVTKFVTDNVTDYAVWPGGEWCRFEPGAEDPSPPLFSIGPRLF